MTQTTSTVEDIIEVPTLFRTRNQGVYEVYKGTWGSYLRPGIDPDADIVEVTDEQCKMFELNENISQIPADLWTAWVDLTFYFAKKVQQNVEVSVRILRSEEDKSKYRFILPLQEVSGASVRANDFQRSIDIMSGEILEVYPPEGWSAVGSSHSHNTMAPFFSSIDDKYELGDPGLHIVVGNIDNKNNKYDVEISVTGNMRRFNISEEDGDKIVDFTPIDDVTYHPDVLTYVSTQFGRFFKTNKANNKYNNQNDTVWKTWKWNNNSEMDRHYSFPTITQGTLNAEQFEYITSIDDFKASFEKFVDSNFQNIKLMNEFKETLQEYADIVANEVDEISEFYDDFELKDDKEDMVQMAKIDRLLEKIGE